MSVNRLLTNVLSTNLEESKQFYTSLFGFELSFDSDWFVHLCSGQLEIGIINSTHFIVPEQAKGACTGHYLTFVVDDLESVRVKAQSRNSKILQQPEETPYGQLRMLIVAPEGTICDVSMPVNM